MPGLMARIPELRGHTVAVVATGEDGLITDFSNRCGIAASWCLAAPGEDVLAAYYGPHEGQDGFRGIATVDGTSFAAPMVSGGLAVMKQLFRNQLSNTALLARLLDTANDRGVYANRLVYGHGLMDLGAATSPVGLLEVTRQNSIGLPGTPLQTTQLLPGPAFGDGLAQSLRGHELAAFDALGAPFWFDLGSFAAPAFEPSMNAQLRDFLSRVPSPRASLDEDFDFTHVQNLVSPGLSASRWKLGLMQMPGAGQAGHLARSEPAVALSVSSPFGLSASAFTTEGVQARHRLPGRCCPGRPRAPRWPCMPGGSASATPCSVPAHTVRSVNWVPMPSFSGCRWIQSLPAGRLVPAPRWAGCVPYPPGA